MDTSKEGIKHWLSNYPERDRSWLATQCGVEKRTVDNWLSSPRDIPAKALRIIESLMRSDAELHESREEPQSHLVIRTSAEEFDNWSRAALAKGQIITDYAIAAIRQAYQGELASKPAPIPADPPANLIELPYFGTVAAGTPAAELDTDDGTHPVPGNYDPATHYVLRVNGESMEPDYPDRSHIVCRKLKDGEFAKKGQDVIACDASGAYFKRLVYRKDAPIGTGPRKAVPRLISINPDFPEVIPAADCPIMAVVVSKA